MSNIKELKINLFEDNDKIFSSLNGDEKIEFKLPEPYFGDFLEEKIIYDEHILNFGKLIFDSIFINQRRELFENIFKELKSENDLIITIISNSNKIHKIPFEIISFNEELLLKRLNIHLIRKREDKIKPQIPSKSLFKILFIISLPLNLYKKSPIDPLKEYSKLYKAFQNNLSYVKIDILESASYKNIIDTITKERYDIIHFSGHGEENGIYLEDDNDYNKEILITNDKIERLFKGVNTKFVFLNACNSSAQKVNEEKSFFGSSVLTKFKDIPIVIGNQSFVTDNFSIKEIGNIYKNIFDLAPFKLLRDVRGDSVSIEEKKSNGELYHYSEWWKSSLYLECDLKERLFIKDKKRVDNMVYTTLLNFQEENNFIYRYEAVREVLELFREDKKIVLIQGIGGSGKSYLADYVIEIFRGKFDYIIAIDLKEFETLEAIINYIIDIFYDSDILSDGDFEELKSIKSINKAWKNLLKLIDKEIFLVLDNFELWLDFEGVVTDIEKLKFIDTLKSEFRGKVLITSRLKIFFDKQERKQFDNIVEIKSYSNAEFYALQNDYYIYRHKKESKKLFDFLKSNKELFQEYDYHPLIINQAIRRDSSDLKAIIRDSKDLDEVLNFYLRYFEKYPSLLKFALLNHPISEEFFNELNSLDTNIGKYQDKLKFLKREEDTFKLYEVIKIYILNHFSSEDKKEILKMQKDELFEILKGFEAKTHGDIANSIEVFEEFEFFTEKIANYYNFIALIYQEGFLDYELAEELFLEALKIRQKLLSDNHEDTLNTYNNLAVLYKDIKNYEKSKEYFLKVLKIDESKFGSDSVELISDYNNLATLYKEIGNLKEAEKYFQKSFNIANNKKNIEYEYISAIYRNFALLYQDIGNYKKSEELLLKLLDIENSLKDKDLSDINITYNNLANLYEIKGDYEKAKEYIFESLKLTKEIYGELHENIATIYYNLASIYLKLGDYKKTEKYLFKSLKIFDNNPNVDILLIAHVNNYLGFIYQELEEYKKAENYYYEAMKILNKLESKHISIANIYNNIASFYKKIGKFEKAEEFYLYTLKIKKEQIGEDFSSIAITYNDLAGLYRLKKDFKESANYYMKALNIFSDTLGENHEYVASVYNNLGMLSEEMKDYDKSEKFYFVTLKIMLEKDNKNYINIARTYHNLATLYQKKKDFKKSNQFFNLALEVVPKGSIYFFQYLKYYALMVKMKSDYKSDLSIEICELLKNIEIFENTNKSHKMLVDVLNVIKDFFDQAKPIDSNSQKLIEKYRPLIMEFRENTRK